MAVEHFAHVLHALRGQFLVQPIHVLADVGHALVQSERLNHVKVALLIDVKSNRIGKQRLCRNEINREAIGELEALHGAIPLIGGRLDTHFLWSG